MKIPRGPATVMLSKLPARAPLIEGLGRTPAAGRALFHQASARLSQETCPIALCELFVLRARGPIAPEQLLKLLLDPLRGSVGRSFFI